MLAMVVDVGPTLNQQCFNVSCLLGMARHYTVSGDVTAFHRSGDVNESHRIYSMKRSDVTGNRFEWELGEDKVI